MSLKKTALLPALFVLGLLPAKAQLFYNAGANVAVTTGGVLYVGGPAENVSGLFSNAGQTTVVGYFRNGGFATGGNSTGLYNIYGDWENNNTFTADQSEVELLGSAQQITGTSVTTFYNLTLKTTGAVKTQTINAGVSNILALNDCELATTDYSMTLFDPATTGVTRNSGFVSSTSTGRLIRATNSIATYLFPTGWNDGGNIYYRPVEMTPSVTDSQSFAVRLAFDDPGSEGYPASTVAGNVTAVNTKFFHLIKQYVSTAPADLSIYYDPSADGVWSSIGRWQNVPEWEDLGPDSLVGGSPLSRRTKYDWIDNGNEPHALINAIEVNVLFNFPNVFAPNSPNQTNATFHIINYGSLATLEAMKIFDRWGEVVFDSDRDGTLEWNGKYRGKLQLMGNYVYTANVKITSTGEIKTVSGNLGLVW